MSRTLLASHSSDIFVSGGQYIYITLMEFINSNTVPVWIS